MILSDFLSRQTHNTSNLHEIIPISFNMYNALYETYLQSRSNRQIFSTDVIRDKSCRSKTTGSTQCKENDNHKYAYRETKSPDTRETGR